MPKVLTDGIGEAERTFLKAQPVFFVATAPLNQDHHVNVSPKAPVSTFAVIDNFTVAYLDYMGSGAETAAHILENRRMTLLFCNLQAGPPKIVRLHGKAKVIPKEEATKDILRHFAKEHTEHKAFRCIYWLELDRVSSSCGYSLPIMEFVKDRSTYHDVAKAQGLRPCGERAFRCGSRGAK